MMKRSNTNTTMMTSNVRLTIAVVLSILLVAVATFSFFGCEPVDLPTATVADNLPAGDITSGTISNLTSTAVNLVPLPEGSGKDMTVTKTVLITPTSNASVSLSSSYRTLLGSTCSRTLTFTVPAGAVKSNVYVTITFDTENAAVKFEPEGLVFVKPAVLDFKVTSLPLLTSGTSFYYVGDNGYYEKVSYQSLSRSLLSGTVDMRGAAIPHFSRYGFGR